MQRKKAGEAPFSGLESAITCTRIEKMPLANEENFPGPENFRQSQIQLLRPQMQFPGPSATSASRLDSAGGVKLVPSV